MKLAFLVPGFSAHEHDWCIPAHTDIVRALAQSHEVHVFAMRYPHRADVYRVGEAIVHSFNGVGSRGGASARLWQIVFSQLRREHRRAPFDLIHAIFGSESGCVATLSGKFLRVPTVVWMVNGEMVGLREIGYGADIFARQRWMNRVILRHANRVLCGCTPMMQLARARRPNAPLALVPLGVNLERFHLPFAALPSPSSTPARFINVGSLTPVKDQANLLRAFELVRRTMPNARLTIVGAGPLDKELRALAYALRLHSDVTFASDVAHDALANLYQASDVFVQASQHEGQGMAMLEAAACGCAVCGTRVGALADLARQDAAIASPVGDAQALAGAMRMAYQERAALSLRAYSIVERDYNLETVAAQLETLYAQLEAGEKSFAQTTIAGA